MKEILVSFIIIVSLVLAGIGVYEYSKFVIETEYKDQIKHKDLAIDSIKNVVLQKNERLFEYQVALDSLKAHHDEEINNLPNLNYHDLYIKYWGCSE